MFKDLKKIFELFLTKVVKSKAFIFMSKSFVIFISNFPFRSDKIKRRLDLIKLQLCDNYYL